MSNLVRLGFGDFRKQFRQVAKSQIRQIERVALKRNYTNPVIRKKQLENVEVDHYKNIINIRKSHALLESLVTQAKSAEVTAARKLKNEADKAVREIDEEANMLFQCKGQLKINEFCSKAQCNEEIAKEYLRQFNNIELGVKTYKQRKELSKKFALTYKMTEADAYNTLKVNEWNMSIFEN